MFARNLLSTAAIVASFGLASAAHAAPVNFEISGASTVTIDTSHLGDACGFLFACAEVTGTVNAASWSMEEGVDTVVSDLIELTITGGDVGVTDFTATANIIFTAPTAGAGDVSGGGAVTVEATSIAGEVSWEATEVLLGDMLVSIQLGGASVYEEFATYGELRNGGLFSFEQVAAVPLPASVPLLMAGLGALGFVGRRKKAA